MSNWSDAPGWSGAAPSQLEPRRTQSRSAFGHACAAVRIGVVAPFQYRPSHWLLLGHVPVVPLGVETNMPACPAAVDPVPTGIVAVLTLVPRAALTVTEPLPVATTLAVAQPSAPMERVTCWFWSPVCDWAKAASTTPAVFSTIVKTTLCPCAAGSPDDAAKQAFTAAVFDGLVICVGVIVIVPTDPPAAAPATMNGVLRALMPLGGMPPSNTVAVTTTP